MPFCHEAGVKEGQFEVLKATGTRSHRFSPDFVPFQPFSDVFFSDGSFSVPTDHFCFETVLEPEMHRIGVRMAGKESSRSRATGGSDTPWGSLLEITGNRVKSISEIQ